MRHCWENCKIIINENLCGHTGQCNSIVALSIDIKSYTALRRTPTQFLQSRYTQHCFARFCPSTVAFTKNQVHAWIFPCKRKWHQNMIIPRIHSISQQFSQNRFEGPLYFEIYINIINSQACKAQQANSYAYARNPPIPKNWPVKEMSGMTWETKGHHGHGRVLHPIGVRVLMNRNLCH